MPRVCDITGARTRVGNRLRYRGRAKYLGGIGKKLTSCTRRTFKPNLQTVTALVDGSPKRITVAASQLRQGKIVKPLKRKYGYTRQQKQAAAAG